VVKVLLSWHEAGEGSQPLELADTWSSGKIFESWEAKSFAQHIRVGQIRFPSKLAPGKAQRREGRIDGPLQSSFRKAMETNSSVPVR